MSLRVDKSFLREQKYSMCTHDIEGILIEHSDELNVAPALWQTPALSQYTVCMALQYMNMNVFLYVSVFVGTHTHDCFHSR